MQTENEAQIEQIEINMERAEGNVSVYKALQRLTDNKDFKRIVLEGYFKDEASRVVLLKADPSVQDMEQQISLDNQIIAIGQLRQYFHTITQIGRMSEHAIVEDSKTHEELLEEGAQ